MNLIRRHSKKWDLAGWLFFRFFSYYNHHKFIASSNSICQFPWNDTVNVMMYFFNLEQNKNIHTKTAMLQCRAAILNPFWRMHISVFIDCTILFFVHKCHICGVFYVDINKVKWRLSFFCHWCRFSLLYVKLKKAKTTIHTCVFITFNDK